MKMKRICWNLGRPRKCQDHCVWDLMVCNSRHLNMSSLLSFLRGSVAETVQGWRHWNPGSFDLSSRASDFKITSCPKMFAGGIQL